MILGSDVGADPGKKWIIEYRSIITEPIPLLAPTFLETTQFYGRVILHLKALNL